jgi:hypothetical protein
MNIGVNVSFKGKDGKKSKWSEGGFEKIKQYLINRMGYSADEISIVSGGLSPIEEERAKNSSFIFLPRRQIDISLHDL